MDCAGKEREMKLPILYKRTASGALQQWEIETRGACYRTLFGQVGRTITTSEWTECNGKNVGRANATSPSDQAELEAKALHTKKLKKDYTLDKNVTAGQTSDLIEGGILPMLAHKFSEHGDKIVYPCFVQPKLDGHRCIAMPSGLWSRTRKPITGVPPILAELRIVPGLIPLDGELYNHDFRDEFEQLTHYIRQSQATPGHECVQYHVYDCVQPKYSFRARLGYLRGLFAGIASQALRLVETREVNDEDELMLAFEDFLAQGYEGAVVRQADGLYVNKRSKDLLKLKKFDDAEFEIVGVIEGKGKLAGHGIFQCKTEAGTVFEAKMKGPIAELQKYYQHPDKYVGKMLTVKYQGITNKNKVPRFPVAWRIAE
jgi:DNA ligase 1